MAQIGSNYEKNRGRKSRWTVPIKCNYFKGPLQIWISKFPGLFHISLSKLIFSLEIFSLSYIRSDLDSDPWTTFRIRIQQHCYTQRWNELRVVLLILPATWSLLARWVHPVQVATCWQRPPASPWFAASAAIFIHVNIRILYMLTVFPVSLGK